MACGRRRRAIDRVCLEPGGYWPNESWSFLLSAEQFNLQGAVLWDHLLDCPFHHFQFDVRTGENHFPKNVYPEDLPHLCRHVRPLKTYAVEVRDGDVWVDLQ